MQNRRKSQKQRGGKAKKYSKNKSKSRRTRSSRNGGGTKEDVYDVKSALTLPNMGFYKGVYNAEEKKVPSTFRF